MARGDPEEGLLKEILDYIRGSGDDKSYLSKEVTKALEERGYWNNSKALTHERTVNSYFNQNLDCRFDRVGRDEFRLKKEHQSSIKDTPISEDLSEPTSPERMEQSSIEDTLISEDLSEPTSPERMEQSSIKDMPISEDLPEPISPERMEQSSIKDTPISEDLSEPTSPERMEVRIYRILRDTKLARDLKNRHGYKCQICSDSINLGDRGLYSEAHHIKPLGSPHNGPDIAENIIVLCPNHHVLADYGAGKIDKKTLSFVPDHSIGDEFIAYHNEQIAKISDFLG